MTHRHADAWGADESVGRTALGVAMARAHEHSSQCPLFTDPYAHLFVDAAASLAPDLSAVQRSSAATYTATRTKWFDEYFLAASAAGLAQVVMLAAGLDTRAWRMPWLSDSVIYEVDRPKLLRFKAATLQSAGAAPAARYVPVPADLGGDWPRALREAGFDPREPTAWSVEGLMPCISAAAQTRLLEDIAALSARSSRIAIEAGSPPEGADVAPWLCAHRWDTTLIDAAELFSRYHRHPDPGGDNQIGRNTFVQARLL
ncbi:SAM-dependent methyltransferase [Mycobacterium sp. SMC-4]|uniref:SAM-dependent methyltransferase n=1 Tax=Mycobacterium sp. SMC-4 TaxID=2857059 RepID=UPI003CFD1733